jgi:hypothetical protein
MVLAQFVEQMVKQWPEQVRPLGEGQERFQFQLANRAIEMRQMGEGVELRAGLGNCPAPMKEDLLRNLMRGNLLGEGTGGAVLAADPTGKELELLQKLTEVESYPEFLQKLEGFVNYANYWAEQVRKNAG